MFKNTEDKTLQEIERLRKELYLVVNGRKEVLSTKRICEVSRRLDKLIVKYMYDERGVGRKIKL